MWALVTSMVGCGGGTKDVIPPRPTEPDDTTPVIDTGLEGGYIDASAFAIVARFAVDPVTGMHRGFALPGEALSPFAVDIVLLSSDALYVGPNATNSCAVSMRIDLPLDQAPWVADAGAWTGFDVPPTASVVDQCRFYGLPADFGGDAASHVLKWQWGVGLGPLDELVEKALYDTLPASEWAAFEPYGVGAVAFSDILTLASGGSPVSTQGFGIGYAVDGNFELVVGGTGNLEPIRATEVFTDPGVARAYYEVQLGPWGPAIVLTGSPGGTTY